MATPLTWREHFLTHALAGTIDALDSALEDRECENDDSVRCDPASDDLCWKCGNMAESLVAAAILEAVQHSATDITYKVWVQVERIALSRDTESYDNIGLPDTLGRFDTLAEAKAFIRDLPGWDPEGSDYRD